MNCPSCKNRPLKPTKLANDLPAASCSHCHGAMVSLLSYRVWLERHPVESQLAAERHPNICVEPADSAHALTCPKCSGIMSKYRIAAETENKIDLCVRCNDVWLDNGEWELIKFLELSDKLPQIFYDSWQKQIRQTQNHALKEEKFKALLGEDYAEIVRIKQWITSHEQRQTLLDYLNSY